jgi:response regulator RpfG family c-di-GMP phosphodiesterase
MAGRKRKMTQNRVLIVDDERGVRESMKMLLKNSYNIDMASSGTEAIARLSDIQPDVVLLDLRMPDMSGIEVLQEIKLRDPNVEVILVTAYATIETARKALRLGAFDYLTKPFNPDELANIVSRGMERRKDVLLRSAEMAAIQQGYQSLCHEVEEAKNLITTQMRDTVYALLMSLELRDAYSGQHSMAVLWLTDNFARSMNVDKTQLTRLRQAALVHDLGKIGIPESILNKPAPLTPADFDTMKSHTILSADIVGNVEALAYLSPIVRAHHERWDGMGYPDKLAGNDIPWESQVLGICDSIHAMTSNRCYRPRLPIQIIESELMKCRGRQFTPELVDAMLATNLITDIHRAEDDGQLVLTNAQVRDALSDANDGI